MQFIIPNLTVDRKAEFDIAINDSLLTIHVYLPASLSFTLVNVSVLLSPMATISSFSCLPLWVHMNLELAFTDDEHVKLAVPLIGTVCD